MAKLAAQLLGNNTAGDRATAGGVKRRHSADAALERPPESQHGQHFIVPVDSSKAKHPSARLRALQGEWEEIAEHFYECNTCLVGLHTQCFKKWHQ